MKKNSLTIGQIKARKNQAEGAICQAVFHHVNSFQHDTGMEVTDVKIELFDASTLDGTKQNVCGCEIIIKM